MIGIVPSTLPTHPLAVLPLKLWRPRWFDGVALATGAAAPDIAYFFGDLVRIDSHTVAALLWWSLPSALFTAWLIRLGAPVVAAHLPGYLRDYGVLGHSRPRWWITVSSALVGAVSHLLFDLVTHPGPIEHWYLVRRISDAASIPLTVLLAVWLGRRGRLREWHGAPPVVPRRPARFWSVAGLVTAAGVVTLALLDDPGVHVLGVRLIVTVMTALLLAAAWVQSAGAPADHRTTRPAVLRG